MGHLKTRAQTACLEDLMSVTRGAGLAAIVSCEVTEHRNSQAVPGDGHTAPTGPGQPSPANPTALRTGEEIWQLNMQLAAQAEALGEPESPRPTKRPKLTLAEHLREKCWGGKDLTAHIQEGLDQERAGLVAPPPPYYVPADFLTGNLGEQHLSPARHPSCDAQVPIPSAAASQQLMGQQPEPQLLPSEATTDDALARAEVTAAPPVAPPHQAPPQRRIKLGIRLPGGLVAKATVDTAVPLPVQQQPTLPTGVRPGVLSQLLALRSPAVMQHQGQQQPRQQQCPVHADVADAAAGGVVGAEAAGVTESAGGVAPDGAEGAGGAEAPGGAANADAAQQLGVTEVLPQSGGALPVLQQTGQVQRQLNADVAAAAAGVEESAGGVAPDGAQAAGAGEAAGGVAPDGAEGAGGAEAPGGTANADAAQQLGVTEALPQSAAAGGGAAVQGHQPPVAVAAGLAPPPPGVVPPAVLLPPQGHQRGASAAGGGAAVQGHQPAVAVAAGLAAPPPGVVPPAVLLPPQGHQRGAAAAGGGAAVQGHQPPVAVAAGLALPPPGVVPPAVLLPPQGHQRGAAAAGGRAAVQGHQPPVAVAAGLAPPPPGVVPPAVLLPPQGHQRGAAAAGGGAAVQGHQPPVAVAAGLALPPPGVVPPAVLLPPQGHQRGAAAAGGGAAVQGHQPPVAVAAGLAPPPPGVVPPAIVPPPGVVPPAVVPPPLPSRTGAGGAALAAAAPPLPPGAARAGVIPVTPVTPGGAGTVKQSFKKGEKKLCVSWLLSYIEEYREGAQLDLAVQALRSDEGLRVEGKLQDLSDEMLTAAWKMAATQAGIEHGIPRKRQVPRVRAGTNTTHGGGLEPAPNTEPAVRNEGPSAHMSWHLLVSQLESALSATVFDAVELDRLYNELHTCPERVSNRQAVLDEMHDRIARRVDEN
ncbi:hypothetical protein PLESTM_000381300 [Pleodorina starrii]|nr:hypothetical protein PLESTM_000381300 [Pleodorina starrii]